MRLRRNSLIVVVLVLGTQVGFAAEATKLSGVQAEDIQKLAMHQLATEDFRCNVRQISQMPDEPLVDSGTLATAKDFIGPGAELVKPAKEWTVEINQARGETLVKSDTQVSVSNKDPGNPKSTSHYRERTTQTLKFDLSLKKLLALERRSETKLRLTDSESERVVDHSTVVICNPKP